MASKKNHKPIHETIMEELNKDLYVPFETIREEKQKDSKKQEDRDNCNDHENERRITNHNFFHCKTIGGFA
jgi:hypothetical protein